MNNEDPKDPDLILTEPLLKYAAASIMKQDIEEFDKGLEIYKTVKFEEEALHNKVLPLIKDLEKKQKKASRKRKNKIFYQIAAGFLLTISLTGTILYNTADAFRITILNIIFTIEEKYTSISLDETDSLQHTNMDYTEFPLELTYIPEGFKLAEDSNSNSLYYENNTGLQFHITLVTKDGTANIDSENAAIKDIELNNKEIRLFIKESKIIAVWQEKDLLFIATGNMDEKTFLDIIAKIK